MKNWKTTFSGIIGILPTILGWFGVPITPEIADGFKVVGLFLIGLFSKDMNVTGGSVAQTGEAKGRVN